MLKEFKAFLMRGNILDLAVAVIIGAAFGAIVKSLVADIITPLILNPTMEKLGAEQLSDLTWNGAKYGSFLAIVLNFIVVAFCIFMIIKGVKKFEKKKEEAPAAPPAPSKEEVLLGEIRDLLKNK